MPTLNIICGNYTERMPRLIQELLRQGITDYKLWDGLILSRSVKESINASHKMIVRWAKENGLSEVCLGEDDLKFSHPDAWKYYLSQKPIDYDLYLGGVFLGVPDDLGVVHDFTGMTLYCISEKFYDQFLSVPDDEHIDKSLDGLGLYYVCRPFVVTQFDGVSSNTGKFEKYGDLVAGREFFNG